jgi:predicted negative regulator of RcsB-dependent stress response
VAAYYTTIIIKKMDNEITQHKNWLQRNAKWLAPLVVVIILLGSAVFSSVSDAQMGGYANALADDALYTNALNKAQENAEVKKVLGTLEMVDQLAIIESNVTYSNNNNAVNLSVRVKGSKAKGRMDVIAAKVNNAWHYSLIKIRIKDPKQEINVLQ